MRTWPWVAAALLTCALGGPASAQARLDCASAPQNICESEDVLALEGVRLSLVQQLAAADPLHAALASEQAWLDGLAACGEDVECYRTAYLNHNQTLRQSLAALPRVGGAAPLDEPPDAATLEETPAEAEEAPPPRRAERAETHDRDGPVYAPSGLPGWGFFTAIGVTLLLFWWLLRKRSEHKRALREDEARLRGRWG